MKWGWDDRIRVHPPAINSLWMRDRETSGRLVEPKARELDFEVSSPPTVSLTRLWRSLPQRVLTKRCGHSRRTLCCGSWPPISFAKEILGRYSWTYNSWSFKDLSFWLTRNYIIHEFYRPILSLSFGLALFTYSKPWAIICGFTIE